MKDHEKVHAELYAVHWDLVSGGNRLHAVRVALVDAGRHQDKRKKLAQTLAMVERAIALSDEACEIAGNARTELIGITGCDASCQETKRSKVA